MISPYRVHVPWGANPAGEFNRLFQNCKCWILVTKQLPPVRKKILNKLSEHPMLKDRTSNLLFNIMNIGGMGNFMSFFHQFSVHLHNILIIHDAMAHAYKFTLTPTNKIYTFVYTFVVFEFKSWFLTVCSHWSRATIL